MATAVKFPPLPLYPSQPNPYPNFNAPKPMLSPCRSLAIRCAKRTGKQRYPSEKKKLRRVNETLLQNNIKNRAEGFWRLSKLGVPAHKDPGKDFIGVSLPLLEAIAKVLEFPVAAMLPQEAFSIVRKSFDARKVLKEPQFVYTVDMDVKKLLNLEPRTWDFIYRLEPKLGVIEYMPKEDIPADLIRILHDCKQTHNGFKLEERQDTHGKDSNELPLLKKPKVAVIGSGPSGLFASLVLGELGAEVTLIERGQAVEQRGRDIGALVVRRVLQSESNFCFGEGGAGTWSDGKLVTRIGRNSDSVQAVMKTLVQFGAPSNILVDGKPHLGTDRLVPLLRNFRQHLKGLGVDIKFGTRLNDLIVENKHVLGVKVCDARHGPGYDDKKLSYDAVVLAVGHSARDVYPMLLEHNVDLLPKDFAVGLRIEHPQQLINGIQREFERRAAIMGGGNFVVPVQAVTDFLENKLSVTSLPPSSYRLGVQASNLHEIFPSYITQALQHAILNIDKELPGFISQDALLHGVETRTSSPVQILRHADTYESTSLKGLYPIGEGAGYAGGIVSAAVDGMYCGFAVAKSLSLYQGDIESVLGKPQKNTGFVKY
uniref:Uncharacterized protein LOC105034784 isoform X3 n=1 Tax=Elaeis guineensis var. tenera TaxID=51953 RepID=A0A6I9QF17_ELAGV|nr:uncharacterized protein LOC105034784 isoform X3 [Elaeis guineensis]